MTSVWFLVAFVAYIALLFGISAAASKKGAAFFASRGKAPWPVVAYGMIGSSISGVSFISVPGNVWAQNFYYLPMVLGFVVGYLVIAWVLLPLYYKKNLTSIYTYLGERFGRKTHITGTVTFMVSRLLGAAARIFVVVVVLRVFVPESVAVVFGQTGTYMLVALFFLAILHLYTRRGGVGAIIWTDVMQTTVMLLAIGLTIWAVCRQMGWSLADMTATVGGAVNPNEAGVGFGKPFVSMFDWDFSHGTNAVKQFVSGVFVTIAMTGLDQAMMQKNLACKDLSAARKNMVTTSLIIVAVNLFFVLLGALLCVYASSKGLEFGKTDELFPMVATRCLGTGVGVFFLLGLLSASFPSAAAALTSLTTSVCVDFLRFPTSDSAQTPELVARRHRVQAAVSAVFFVIVVALCVWSNDAAINMIYKLASYTYGPLLGIFFYGLMTRRAVIDSAVPFIAVASPLLCLGLNYGLKSCLGFDLGFSLLIVNAALCFCLMHIFSRK